MADLIYILNGPNLNLLGEREPEIYGHTTLKQIEESCQGYAKSVGYELVFKQSNHEGELVDWIQEARLKASGIILNAASLTHTSVALRDALAALKIPVIELHISNIYGREPFRKHSYFSDIAMAVICGFGADGYRLALQGLVEYLKKNQGASSC